jgi:arylsulfatase A-like enzyme
MTTDRKKTVQKPNILMILVDQMRFPRFEYGEDHGFVEPLKDILGFKAKAHDANEFRKFFPGLSSLTNNAVVLKNHKTASAACVPSRTVLFTGQYGTKTGSVQTDGVFKDGVSDEFPWLDSSSFPTLGHWMREYDYTTHYFGKWHISGEETTSLEDYGFSDWELSCPDPHGTLPNNLGYYRDYQFEDIVTSFIRRQGLGIPYSILHAKENVSSNKDKNNFGEDDEHQESLKPWFAVSSFTNPHDIGAYPGIPSTVCDARVAGAEYTLAVPPQNSEGTIPKKGSMKIKLNKLGFPQNNANVPLTWNEELKNKPDCQKDYTLKMGLALASKAGRLVSEKAANAQRKLNEDPNTQLTKEDQLDIAVAAALSSNKIGLPFALTDDPELSSRAFMQYYGYLMHEVDQHINKVLETLEESGQAENTIVMFCADHGEYGASHGMMMEKWHSAYEEVVHVPMLIRFPTSMHQVAEGLKQVSDLTSHIDLLPTILGLAGADNSEMDRIKTSLQEECNQARIPKFSDVHEPVGLDLSSLIRGESSTVSEHTTGGTQGKEREGVLFITHDTITEPFESEKDEVGKVAPTQFEVYKASVDALKDEKSAHYREEAAILSPDSQSVCQPNHVHCVMSKDNWKLVRYFEPDLNNSLNFDNNNQFELYDLNIDPNEINNLVVYNDTSLQIIEQESGERTAEVCDKALMLMSLLRELEADML